MSENLTNPETTEMCLKIIQNPETREMCLKILLNPNFLTYGNIIVLIKYTEKTYKPPEPKNNIRMYRQL